MIKQQFNKMAFAAPSLRLRCAFAAPSLRLRCAFAAPPAFSFSAKLSTRFLMISLLCLAFCGAPFVSTGQNVQVTPVGLFDNVFDRFGGKHKLADIVIATPQNQAFLRQIGAGNAVAAVQPACATSGYFRLFANNGGAYTTHTAQVAVLCQVLSDISDFLPRPTTATGTVDIFLSDWGVLTPPSPNASAMATSMYSYPLLNTPTGGVLEGEVWKTINGGKDSYQGIVPPILTTTNGISGLNFYHGLISFNTNLNWHTDLQIPPTNTELDMYSVMLHEVTHMLGFASLISSNGQSIIHPNPTYYSLYDTFLQTADGIPLLSSTNDCDSEMYDNLYDTNLINNLGNGICGITMPDPNTTDCHTAIVYNNNSTVQRQEVYNPACYARGSSLSHFEDECESLTHAAQNDLYFVMSNSNGFGQHYEKHYLKPEERSVLCDLGYEVLDSYGTSSVEQLPFSYGATSACTDRRPVGYNDGINTTSTGTYSYTTSLGTAISIYDILSNDTNTDIASCYEVISGTGAFTAQTGQGFTYNPAATGLHLIRYIPISSTGRKGNITYVFIYVFAANSPSCGITACNRVANSGFEVGNNCGPWYQQSPPACWNALQGTPDAYQLNCPIANLFSFGQQGYYAINPFPYNQTATGVTNFAYMGLVCEDRPTLVWDEAMQTTLTTPLVAGVSYRIKFHAATSMSTSPPQLIVAASPQTISPDVLGNFDNLQNNTLIQFFGTSAIIPINNNGFWDEYQAVFTYTPTSGAAPDLHNLIITTNHHLLVPSPTTNVLRFYVYIDDISLEEDDGGLPFTLPTCFQAGTAIALDANITIPTITFTGDDILNNVLTPVAGHGNYTIYYHYLKLNGCVVEGSQQINENTIPPIILMNGTPCLGQPTMLHVNTGSGFSWSTGELTHTITVSPTSPTTYTVTVTFCTGVTATTSITVTPILTTPVSIDVADPCAVGNTDISVTPATLLDYAWNTGQSGQNLSTLTVQTGALYTVTATDSNGCTSTANTFVNQPPTVFITGVNVYAGYAIILSSNASSAAHAIGANGGAMFTYEWSNGDTNNSTTINAIGIYTVTVTDSGIYGTCTASATFEVVTCRPNTQVAVHIGAPNTTTFWSLLPTIPTANTQYIVDGELVFDRALQITGGDFLMQPGAHISIAAERVDFTQCKFRASCGMMWQGISIQGQRLLTMQKSIVRDAHFGVETLAKSYILSLDNQFIDCYIGIYTSDDSYEVNWLRPMERNGFATSPRGLLPAYPNQPIEFGARIGKAGAWLFGYDQFDTGTLPTNGVVGKNTFTNLSNGLVLLASNAHLENIDLTDIGPAYLYDSPPPLPDMPDASSFNGTGIMIDGGYQPSPTNPNYGAFILSSHRVEIGNNTTAVRCHRGIRAQTVNTAIETVRFFKTNTAIDIQQPDFMEVVLRNNYIHHSRLVGIAVNGIGTHGCAMTIENNTIYAVRGTGINLESIDEADENAPNIVRNNTIDVQDVEGIHATDTKHVSFTDNQINLLNGYQNKAGIQLNGCEALAFSCNSIRILANVIPLQNTYNRYGSPAYFPVGLIAAASTNCQIACTTTNNCFTGMLLESDCTGTEIQTSSIGNAANGLVFSPTLVLQDQIGNGNHFTGTNYLGVMARHEGSLSVAQLVLPGQFKCPGGTTETPTNSWAMPNLVAAGISPNLSMWYNDFLATQTCSTTCNPGVQAFTTNPNNVYMQRIAKAEYKHPEYEAEMHKWSQMTLYEKLKEQPNLMLNDSVLTNFMLNKDSTVVAGLYSTKKTIAEAGKLTASDKTIRTAHATQRATIALQLKVINTELVNNPQADTAVLYAQQRALYEALHAENTAHQGYLLAFAQQRATQIANAKLQNNAVAPTVAVYEANEKTINEVMLNTVEVGVYSFTNVEKQLINNIANTCPIIAGPACYRARCLRSVYEPNIDYNDVDLCQQVGIAFRKPRSSVKEEVKYTVFPNPTNNTLAIQRSQGNVESESLLLTDVLGRIILKKVLIGIDNSIDVNTIPSGIYYLKIESTEQLDYIQKISIIH